MLPPITLADEVIVEAAEITPPVRTLPPVTLAVADTCPAVVMLPPSILAELVMVDVAEIMPPVRTLPPVTLAVADTCPPVIKLPPTTLAALVMVDVALIKPAVSKLPPITLPFALIRPVTNNPERVNKPTLLAPATVIPMLPLAAAAMFEVPAVIGKPAVAAATPVSCEPLPMKNAPVLAMMLPTADTTPPVKTLPPTTLAVALSVVLEITLAPLILPPDPLVLIFPNVALPVALT